MAELCGCRRIYAVCWLRVSRFIRLRERERWGALTKAEVGRTRSERDPLHSQDFVEKVMLLKDVKSSRKVNLAVFRQCSSSSLSVLGSRKLSSGNGEHFWSASL
jgi:hypothetical protein